jgi:hypothetical protein
MKEFYTFKGQSYEVDPSRLEEFLGQFPNATKVDGPGKTTDPASNVMDSGSGDGLSGSRETSWWRGEEGFIPDEFQPGVSRPDVQVDAKTLDPVGEMQRQSKMTQKDVLIDVYGTSDKKEIEEIKYKKSPIGEFMTKHNKKHEETKKRLIDMYGTSDPEQIIALEATNEDGDTVGGFVSAGERDDVTLLNKNNLPTWEDKEIMDYIYAPYMKDAQTIPTKFLDLVGSAFGAASGTEYATPENERQRNVFYDRFFSGNTDRSPIVDIINTKQSTNQENKFDAKHDLDKGLDIVKKGWVDNARLSGFNAEVFEKLEKGDFEGAVALNEKNGMFTLYEKDGAYINWNDLSEEEKENADPNKIKSTSKEDEERALILAQRNKPAKLQLQHKQDYHDLTAAINMYRSTHGDATRNWKPGVGSVKIGQSVDGFNNAMLKAVENGELTSGLVELVGDDEVTRNYNDKLKKFLITGRALELNQDVSKLKEESFIPSLIYKSDEFADYTADEQVELFPEYMKEIGVEMTDDWKKVTREGGDWGAKGGIEAFGTETDMRDIAEGGRDFVKHIAPLVASLAITKKIPLSGITKISKGAKGIKSIKYFQGSKTLGGEVSKKFTGIGNWMKGTKLGKTAIGKRVIDVGIGGAEELVYLSLADQVGGKLFDMDPMVYNPETDELNWEFAFGLGAGNVIGKKVINKLSNTGWGSSFLSRVSKVKTLEKATQRGLGATAGVGSMEIAKIFSGDSELVKLALDGGELTEEQKNEMKLGMTKQMASDWIGMFALGYITPGSKVGEAIQKDIQNFNINVLNTSKSAKKLGIKENVGADAIDAAVNKKKAETTKKWLKSKRTEEDANTREKELKEIEDAASNMNGRLHIKLAKELISGDKKRLAEVERQIYVFNRKIGAGEKLNGQNILDLAGMKKAEFDYLLKKMNNPMAAEALNARRDFYVGAREYVKDFKNITNRKEAVKFLEETVEYLEKNRELEALKSDKSANNGAKIEVAKLELEPIKQKHTDRLVELNNKYKEAVNRELLVAKKIATSLGAEFEIAKDTDAYIKKGGKAGTAGYHYVEKGKSKILVDPVKAAEAQTIGTGIHETVHHILKDAFKKDGKVTNEGIAIIDKFLDSLGDKDRKFLEGEIEQRDYKSKKKEDYYEEYLTTYVEGLKNKDIKLDLSTAQKIENVLLPHLNKVFPNLGKKAIKYSTKDAEDLKEMLNDIFSESERLGSMSKYEVKDFMVESPVKTAEAVEAFSSEKSFSKYPEMKKINTVGEKYTRQEWKDGKWMEGYEEILPDIIKVLTKKSFEANAKYPGIIADPQSFAFQVANELGGLNPNQQKVGGHVRNFNIEKKTYDKEGAEFGLSGWINNVADLKLLNVLKRADKIIGAKKTKSLDIEETRELVDEGPSAIDIIDTKITNETARRILLESEKAKIHELIGDVQRQKGEQAKAIHDGIRRRFTTINAEGKEVVDVVKLMETVKGKKMKNLPVLVLPETIKLFIGERRNKKGTLLYEQIADKIKNKKNLDKQDIKALQDGLDRWIPMIAEYVVPEGFITKEVKGVQVPSETTNVPRKIQAITHTKRSIAGVTAIDGKKIRSDENFFGQYKKKVTVKLLEDLRKAIGIMPDGTRNLATRDVKIDGVVVTEGVGETIKGVVTLTERMFTSQGLRQPMYEMGKIFEPEMLAIADGKPPKSWSNVNEKKTLDKLKLSYQIDPVKTSEFIGKIQRAWETLSDVKWNEFKDKNGRDVIDGIEGLLLTPESKGDKTNYTKDNFKGDTPAHAFIREMASKGGIMKDAYKMIVRDSNGKKVLSKAGEKQIDKGRATLENMLPIMLNVKGITAMLGFKGKSFDGRTMPNEHKGVDVRNTKSKLSKKQVEEKVKRFEDQDIDVDAILDAVPMVKESPIIKKSLNTFMKGNKSVAEKFTESEANGNKDAIAILNEGNVNLHKALVETNKELFANKIIDAEYVFNEGKLQTNITSSKRAVSTFKMIYVVDGKQVADAYGTSKQMSHTSKGKFEGTMQEYYDSPKYKEYLKDWKECVEWNERYNENLKDPKLKESAEKNEIKPETQAEKQTIEDLVPFNEHINGNANAMVEGNKYIFSNGKGGKEALDAIGRDHATAWVPAYIAKKMLDFYGPNVSKKGYGRLTAYLPSPKLNNMYTYDGKRATEYIAETQRFKEIIDKINNTQKTNVTKAINNVIKNYSKLKGRDPLKDLKNISKSLELGRERNKKARGMSTWDFDDTLATTKSGVRARIPNADGLPKPNRKVIFLAGGAGSGKGNVVKKLNLEGQGFKLVNSDISLEWLKKNNGLPENMNDLTKEQRSTLGSLQHQARGIAKRKMMKYKGNADGVVVDGTGGSIKSMEALVKEFKDKGYDVSMLFVETSLNTALARNKARAERSLLDKIVEKNHEAVQGNKSGFKTMFGERFMEVKTDKLKQEDAMPAELVAKMKDFVSGYEKIRLDAEQFATEGQKILDKGGKFDFSEFNVVTEGAQGPFFQKAMARTKKFGTENQFVLTARPPEAAGPIYEFLKSQGLEIPLKNITGLGNSTGEAKAMWMLEKFAEGYNDMYFADDAIQNVKAVKDVLDQLDIKSKVQQAYSKVNLNKGVNKIMEHSLNIGSEKVFSKAEAKVRGKDIKRRRVFMRDSAADLELLIEPLYGKGKEGIKNKEWFKENLVMPFERGIRDYNTARQNAKNDYINLRKQNKDVVKEISQPVEGTAFTNDMAMRVYLWNKAGYKIPDLAKTTEAKLVEHIRSNPKLQAYAESFARITKQEKGLKEPGENWWGETMAGEVTNINRGVSRKQYLQEWIDAKNEIFTEANLNKMESKLGTNWRENIADMFDRMETGRTRSLKLDKGSAAMMNYLNGGIGTIMNFNTRSAVLQTISTTNFLNMRENNPIAAARAMGNVKQFAKDFKYIMNSDMLKQRRDGLAINVTEAELASAAASSTNPIQGMIAKVLKAGYLPTKMADSFAISLGGATFYRNRIKMYEKQGIKTKEAEKQAFLDFQVIAERTQQSSRADLLSKEQTSLIGRFILPFANTPMQMNRAGIKDILDLSKGRYKDAIEATEKVGRISYYMGLQVAIFAGLQSALFAMLLNDDDVPEEKLANTKSMMLNTTADSMLRGFGIPGATMSAFKNATQEYFKQNAKPGFTVDYSEVAEDLLNISPPIGSKFGMLDRAGDKKKWAKIKKNDEFKFELGNPSLEASLMTVQAVTNAPVYSPYQNIFNMQHALSDQYETWQRVLMGSGWTPYSVGIETEDKKKKESKKKKTKTYRVLK